MFSLIFVEILAAVSGGSPGIAGQMELRAGTRQTRRVRLASPFAEPSPWLLLDFPFATRGRIRRMHTAMNWERNISGGILGVIGFMLSLLSWWNDAFVNLPLALAFAWSVSWCCPADVRERTFQVSLVVGYWLTNALGFVLMHKGARALFPDENKAATRRELVKDIGVSLALHRADHHADQARRAETGRGLLPQQLRSRPEGGLTRRMPCARLSSPARLWRGQ
jgi:hypothetical protein